MSCVDGETRCLLTHSYFLCRRNCELYLGSKLSYIRGGVMHITSNFSSYYLQCIQTLTMQYYYILLELCVGTFPLQTWNSTKSLSSVSCSFSQCFTQTLSPWSGGCSWFISHYRVHSQDQGLFANYAM